MNPILMPVPMNTTSPARTGGQILVDQLILHGVKQLFCVPGESFLAVLDALHDAAIDVTVCRQEGGAAMMAEAQGKLTGRPGVCFVTRGPGATNAAAGIHIAHQDSTPMLLFVGQVARGALGREAFQELDYGAVFGTMAKWVVQIDDAKRIPELVSRAFHVATSGRPGPVVIALPEDMLTDAVETVDALPYAVTETSPSPTAMVWWALMPMRDASSSTVRRFSAPSHTSPQLCRSTRPVSTPSVVSNRLERAKSRPRRALTRSAK